MRLLALALAFTLATGCGGSARIDDIPNPRTRDGTWVTDVPGALRPDTIATLNRAISELERTTGVEVAVVVVGSLGGSTVEEVAERIFRRWGIGKAGQDNGLLFLWSTGDRRVRIEVGYGLEPVLPDGKVGALLDTYVIPRFRAGQYDEGVVAGVDALARAVGGQPVPLRSLRSEDYQPESSGRFGLWMGLLSAVPLAVVASVVLRRWRRNRRRRCPQCRTRMRRLDEAEDDEHLDEGQRAEERLKSVDYDVWSCPGCSFKLTLRYPRGLSSYDTCPQCSNRTKSRTKTVVEPATRHGEGSAQVVEHCEFCSYHVEYTVALERLAESSGSSSSWGSSGGGSSFGGGRSGGGGASRGY